jgi:hypothetical protein
MRDLPYSKTADIASMDAAVPQEPTRPKKTKPAVPPTHCHEAYGCKLRKDGKCSPLHCFNALKYKEAPCSS